MMAAPAFMRPCLKSSEENMYPQRQRYHGIMGVLRHRAHRHYRRRIASTCFVGRWSARQREGEKAYRISSSLALCGVMVDTKANGVIAIARGPICSKLVSDDRASLSIAKQHSLFVSSRARKIVDDFVLAMASSDVKHVFYREMRGSINNRQKFSEGRALMYM